MRNDPRGLSPAIETLDDSACRALLARHRLCTLSVVDGDLPYAIPLFYGFDGVTLYLGLAEGRKTRLLDANPAVCITVTEVAAGDAWASVMVTGRAEWLEGADREAGVRVLSKHNQRVRAAGGATDMAGQTDPAVPQTSLPPRRHGGGRILRVLRPVITGRARP